MRYFDRAGLPMTREEWSAAFEDNRVAHDEVGGVEVSTVWLGLDHQHGDGPPLIFETMIFGGPRDQEQLRYSSEDAALKGHGRVVAELRESAP